MNCEDSTADQGLGVGVSRDEPGRRTNESHAIVQNGLQ